MSENIVSANETMEEKKMMMLSEMSREALKDLYENNETLKEWNIEWTYDEFNLRMDEIFSYFREIKGTDYEMGGYYDYFRVEEKAYYEFLSACLKLNHDMGVFKDETAAMIQRGKDKAEFYYDAMLGYYDISDARFENLEKWLKGIIDTATNEIISYYRDTEDYYTSEEGREECFWDVWLPNNEDNYQSDGRYLYELDVRKFG